MNRQRRKEWFDDEALWRVLTPLIFSKERCDDAVALLPKALKLAKPRGKEVLNLCCGPGRWAIPLARILLALRGKEAGAEVIQWLTRSAQQGNVEAQYRLGLFLYEGKLVPGDNITAGQWILLAAGTGSVEAKSLLKEMELFLSADELAEARKRVEAFKPVRKSAAAPQK